MAEKKILANSIIGVMGGISFFIGMLMVTPFLGKTKINFGNITLLVGISLLSIGVIALTYSVINFTEA